ncbi:MAG: TonB-dependent receptor, partial [Massilia sp.]
GGTWKSGGLTADFFAGDAKSDFTRVQRRMAMTQFSGRTTFELDPSGLWNFTSPPGVNQGDPLPYAQLYTRTVGGTALGATNTVFRPNYTTGQQPLRTLQSGVNWIPQIRETGESTAKIDVVYRTPQAFAFINRIKGGYSLRDSYSNSWEGGAGDKTVKAPVGTYGQPGFVPGIYLPSARREGRIEGCQNTPGSLAPGGDACQYGYNVLTDPRNTRDGTLVLTPQQFQAFAVASLVNPATNTSFFNGARNRPAGLIDNWTQLDIPKALAYAQLPNMNFDCVKSCMATDGKIYDQPANKLTERVDAFYLMSDFNIDRIPFTKQALPFGLEIDGNIGTRYVRTKVHGTGSMTFNSFSITQTYDPKLPGAAGGFIASTVVKNTSVDATSNDILPSLNLAMWLVPDKLVIRYNIAKTVARPPVNQLLPSGTCNYDQRYTETDANPVQRCSNTIGNPALKARLNVNQNLSAEYYPNKDTMFTLAVFNQRGKVGQSITQSVSGGELFAGSELIDPLTGVDMSTLPFNYTTYVNGPNATRKGAEFSTKTAFTFLPGLLRYTGFDANYTKVKSSLTTGTIVDLLTGDIMPPARESKTQFNLALWYDDGRLSARVALQGAASWFTCLSPCGQTPRELINYPAQGGGTNAPQPLIYSPGSPNFKDATRYIDGKIGYKWKPGVELFIEGRNLANATTSNSQGQYAPLSNGVPNLLDYAYAGRRIMLGVQFRTL